MWCKVSIKIRYDQTQAHKSPIWDSRVLVVFLCNFLKFHLLCVILADEKAAAMWLVHHQAYSLTS